MWRNRGAYRNAYMNSTLEVSNTGNVKLDFGAHPEQLDEADVGAMDAMGAMDGMDDLDGV